MGDSLIAELKKVHARVPIKTITYLREEGTKPLLDIPTAARIQKFADENLILVAPARTWEDRLPWGIPIRH